jgi:hypothetical protein
MATVEDKEIPGGLLSFFRSYEHVYSIIFVFCFTSRVICGLFFFLELWSFWSKYHGCLIWLCRGGGRTRKTGGDPRLNISFASEQVQ